MSDRYSSDDEAPEEVSFSRPLESDAQAPRPSRKRGRGLQPLRIAPVPVSAEMLELLSQQQRAHAQATAPGDVPSDDNAETEEERRRRLRRQARAKRALEESREQSRSLVRREVRCGCSRGVGRWDWEGVTQCCIVACLVPSLRRNGIPVDVITLSRVGKRVDVSAEAAAAAADSTRDSAVAYLEGHLHGARLRRVPAGAAGGRAAGGGRKALRAPAAAFRAAAQHSQSSYGPVTTSTHAVAAPPATVAPTGAASSRAWRRAVGTTIKPVG